MFLLQAGSEEDVQSEDCTHSTQLKSSSLQWGLVGYSDTQLESSRHCTQVIDPVLQKVAVGKVQLHWASQ